MAVALGWGGSVDTDLAFTEFFSSDFTILVRFLPEYVYAYEGPLLTGTNPGSGNSTAFEFGLGYFPGNIDTREPLPFLKLRVGGEAKSYDSSGVKPGGTVLADFEQGSYAGWTVAGNCFGAAPALGTLPDQGPVRGFLGRGLVNTFLKGDGATGRLTSAQFTIARPFIRFLIGGGHHPGRCCLNLLVGGKVVRSATGRHSEQLTWQCWEVREFIGQPARLEIIDEVTGAWGHLLIDQIELCDGPLLQAGLWQELALVRTLHPHERELVLYTPYLNGEKLGEPITARKVFEKEPIPGGKLRIGGRGFNDLPGQFYGLIDEVGVFTRTFDQQELRGRVLNPARLTGSESQLHAGWTFTAGSQPAKLNRPLALGQGAELRATTPGHNSARDAEQLPPPRQVRSVLLPFPPGEEWTVIQQVDVNIGSHSGYAAFCWDFVRAAGATEGAPVYSISSGTVVVVEQIDPKDDANIIEVRVAPDEIHGYLHLKANASKLKVGSPIAAREQVSTIGQLNHLHFGAANRHKGEAQVVTRPVAFLNYERKNPDGSWTLVPVGMPKFFETIRRPFERRYDAVWRQTGGAEIQVYGRRFADFKAEYDELWKGNWRLHLLNTYSEQNQRRYDAVWRQTGGAETQVYGCKFADFKANYEELWKDNWRLHILNSYVENSQRLYDAVWRQTGGAETQIYGYKFADFKAKYDELWKDNWRLHLLNTYVENNQRFYDAVWRQTGGAETQVYGYKFADLKAKYDTLWKDNWRLHLLNNYVENNQRLYDAVWRQTGGAETQSYDWMLSELKVKYDELWKDNWRLHILNPL